MKEIKNTRSRDAQGTRAGFVSQVIVLVLDAAWILIEYVVLLMIVALVRGLFTSASFHLPKPDAWVSLLALYVIGIATLEAGWSGTGRAPGMGLFGLRVVAADGSRLSPRRAFWRSVLVMSTFGLLVVTALFSRRNESLYDKWCGSAVIYDWRAAGPGASVSPPASPPASSSEPSEPTESSAPTSPE